MANTSLEPDPTRFIKTPLQTYYGVQDEVIYPHILFVIAILTVVGMAVIV